MTLPPYLRRLSASRLDAYDRCPQLFKERYVDGLASPPIVELSFGSAVHYGLEMAYRGDDGQQAFLRRWLIARRTLAAAGLRVDPSLTSRGLELVQMALDLGYPGEPERHVLIHLADLPVPIVGVVDLWDETTHTVVDWKTSRGVWKAAPPATTWQPLIYTQAYVEATGVPPTFRYVVLPKSHGAAQTFDVQPSPSDMYDGWQKAREIYSLIERQFFDCSCHGKYHLQEAVA